MASTDPLVRPLSVAVKGPFRHPLSYLTRETAPPLGSRVAVPLRNRTAVGIVTGVEQPINPDDSPIKYKYIDRVLDDEPLLDERILQLCVWVADYYFSPLWAAISLALPPSLRKQLHSARAPGVDMFRLSAEGQQIDSSSLTPKQQQVVTLLREHDALSSSALREAGLRHIIAPLEKRSLIERYRQNDNIYEPHQPPRDTPLELSTEQRSAVDAVSLQQGYQTTLLQGVTGSGKTEVYLTLVERALSMQRQALILVPEIALTPQLMQRFSQHLQGRKLLCIHSAMSAQQRVARWLACANGEVDVLLGTRSAVLAPMPRLGIIVVDEEHDTSYKEQSAPCYSARDLAVKRAHLFDIPAILGSATPSSESLHNTTIGRYEKVRLTPQSRLIELPHVHIQDTRKARLHHGELSEDTVDEIRAVLTQGKHQVLLFRDQRGYAPSTRCSDCGWTPLCERCDVNMVAHRNPNRMICHLCGWNHSPVLLCHECGSRRLNQQGVGTERLEHIAKELFPDIQVVRIDRDSMRNWSHYLATLKTIRESDTAMLLIGTRMLSKGHDLPNLKLVCILGADRSIYAPDFRALEHTGQLLIQLSGRAGRTRLQGKVVIPTNYPDHPIFLAAQNHDYDAVIDYVNRQRQTLDLPPYGHLGLLRGDSQDEKSLQRFMHSAFTLGKKLPGITAIGPMPGQYPKRDRRYYWQLILSAKQRPVLHQALNEIAHWTAKNTPTKVHTTLDIDPQNIA